MNVLAKTKKYFLGLIKGDNRKVERHSFFQSFLKDWNTLLSSSDESLYNDLLKIIIAKYPSAAISYCTGTWLHLWKEKIVVY